MRAIVKKTWADVRRRRTQTFVVASLALLATAVMALAVTLLTASSRPYRTAFERQNGGHVVAFFDARFVTADQVAATGRSQAVVASGGPWPTARLPFQVGPSKLELDVMERGDPGGVDTLGIAAGRWLARPGEIVLTRSLAEAMKLGVGDRVVALGGARGVSLRVVGLALDVDTGAYPNFMIQPAWVLPGQLDGLPGAELRGFVMAYRLHDAATAAGVSRGTATITRGLPEGAVTASISYLLVEQFYDLTGSLILTYLVVFGVVALAAAGVVVANVVAGAVLAGYREIGITRALGFTPAQAVLGLMLAILLPALAGAALGTPVGLLLSVPLLQQSFHVLGLPAPGASPLAALPGLLVLLVMGAGALPPAVRAGRLRPVRAISVGGAPAGGRRSRRVPLVGRARLPRWLTLGAGEAYARPLRGALTTVAVLVGVATLTFAFGFARSLESFVKDRGFSVGRGDVVVERLGDYPDATLMRTLADQPETGSVVAYRIDNVRVDGVADPVQVQFWRGRSDQLGFHVLQGRWFDGPDEVVAGPVFLKQAHLGIGSTFEAGIAGRRAELRVVGAYFTTNALGNTFNMDWSTMERFGQASQPSIYQVLLRPGSDAGSHIRRVAATTPTQLEVQDLGRVVDDQLGPTRSSLHGILVILVAVLTLIAAVGVFNTVLLNTKERVRDTAVLRTLGMSPGRTVAMVCASAGVIGAVGGVLGAAGGVLVYSQVLGLVTNLLGSPVTGPAVDVYGPLPLVLLATAGLLVAVAAALLPARWAAATPVAAILHAE